MTKRQWWGVFCICAPWALIVMTLAAYAIASFFAASLAEAATSAVAESASDPTLAGTVGGLVRVLLGFVGIVAIAGIPIGTGVGLYLLLSEEKVKKNKHT